VNDLGSHALIHNSHHPFSSFGQKATESRSEPELSMELTLLHVSDFYPLLLLFSRLSSRLHLQLGDRCFSSELSVLAGPFSFLLETVGNSMLIL